MTAALIAKVLQAGLLIWLVLLMALLLGKMVKGKITTRGLLTSAPQRAGQEIQPERAVAMLILPMVLLHFVLDALNVDVTTVAPGVRPSLPDIPEYLVTLFTGGNGIYLAGKMFRPK